MKFILCLVGLVAVDAITIQPMPKDAVELKVRATTTHKHSDGDHDHNDGDHDHSDSDHDHSDSDHDQTV